MMEGREGQGLNFWELHRKLAECYQQDVQYGRRRAPSTASVSMRLPSSSELPVVRPVISPPSPTGLRVSTTRRTLESSNEVGHSTRDAVASRPEVGRGKSESSDLAKPREGEEGLKPREAWCPVLEHKSAKLMARAGSMASLKATVTTLSESISVEAAETWSFVLHPAGRLRTVWDALTVIALVLDIILIPLEFFGIQELQGVTGATVITILFWSLDVVLSFRSGSYKKGVLVMEPKTIARDYARSWLVPDLALVGLDWLALAVNAFSEDASQVLWLLRLLRLVRVLRLGKVSRSALNLKEAMQWTVNRRGSVAMNLGLLLLLNHMIACGWWAFGHAWGDASGWSVTNGVEDQSLAYRYTTSLHWAISQLGVSSTEIEATNTAERIYSIATAVISLITFSSMVSSMTSVMNTAYQEKEEERRHFAALQQYLKHYAISASLSQRITQFVQHALGQQRNSISDVPLLTLLSKPLQGELQLEKFRELLSQLSFLGALLRSSSNQIEEVMRGLASAMGQATLAGGDVLFRLGTPATASYLPLNGSQLLYSDSQAVSDIWTVEMCLWTEWFHVGNMVSVEVSQVLILDMPTFCDIVGDSCITQRLAADYAVEYLAELHKVSRWSDIWQSELRPEVHNMFADLGINHAPKLVFDTFGRRDRMGRGNSQIVPQD
ncbi:unnamed protein product [Effrenium voratum]|nr:unnamed protein product [Effrenium voratum]